MNTRSIRRLAVVAGLAALSVGCASHSLSEHQCTAGDWQTVGYNDGVNGVDQGALLRHQEACGRFEIVPNRTTYLAGWNEGIQSYCTADNGFAVGRAGQSFRRVCPGSLSASFQLAYDDGRAIFDAERRVAQIERSIDAAESRLIQIDEDVLDLAAAQINPDLTPDERVALFADIKHLQDERERLEFELPQLFADLDQARLALDAVERGLATR